MAKLQSQKKVNYGLIPLLAILGILPMISRLVMVDTKLSEYPWFPNMESRGDFFLNAKSRVFFVLVVFMIIIMVDMILIQGKKIIFTRKFIPLLLYAGFCILSTVMTENKFYSLHGLVEQFETVWILLGYILTVYYCFIIIREEGDIRILLGALFFSAIIMGGLGIFQFFHMDFFETEIGKSILIPEQLKQYRESVMFNFSETSFNRVYMTLYNPNYVGVYITLISPILVIQAIACKNKIIKCLALILEIILLICMLGSGSKTSLVMLPLLGVTGCFFFGKQLVSAKKQLLLSALILILGVVVFDGMTENSLYSRLKQSFGVHQKTYSLQEVKPDKDYVEFVYNGDRYYFNSNYNETNNLVLRLWDSDNKEIEFNYNNDNRNYIANDPRISDFTFTTYEKDNIVYVVMEYKGIPWRFANSLEEGTYQYISINGKIDTIEKAKSILFNGYETILTYRGYTWGRTLPLLKNYIFYGAGPDQFALVFPQNDYVMRSNMSYGFFTEILTKPHNLYLQIATQTGVLSLVCFLLFCGNYIIRCFKLYLWKSSYQYLELTGISICLGVIGYLFCGMTNDSCVAIAPMFWVIIGVGVAVNEMNSLK